MKNTFGGEAGIRTLEGVAPSTVFKTAAFNRSATSPESCPQARLQDIGLNSKLDTKAVYSRRNAANR